VTISHQADQDAGDSRLAPSPWTWREADKLLDVAWGELRLTNAERRQVAYQLGQLAHDPDCSPVRVDALRALVEILGDRGPDIRDFEAAGQRVHNPGTPHHADPIDPDSDAARMLANLLDLLDEAGR
jgi:hypothetical protein